MATFKKLVRDNIPTIIEENGEIPVVRTLDDAEYRTELQRKLMEEVAEYISDETPDELADVMEVVYALGALHQLTPADLEKLRVEKAEKRGGFTKRIYLESVEEAEK